jgi:hypothetical protein
MECGGFGQDCDVPFALLSEGLFFYKEDFVDLRWRRHAKGRESERDVESRLSIYRRGSLSGS